MSSRMAMSCISASRTEAERRLTMRYFEDFIPGTAESYGSTKIDEASMLDFAREFDPQPMHLDGASEQAARVGGLIASGWFTCARNMRLMADHFILSSSGLGSPGVSSLKWSAPVRAGDRLTGRMQVLSRKASRSKPDRGFVNFRFELHNQDGVPVLEQTNLIMFARREPGREINDETAPELAIPAPQAERFSPIASPDADSGGFIEDIPVDRIIRFGSYRFEPATMIHFAERFDPQAFHLSEEAGRASHFGGLSASGWHTAAAWMGVVIRYWQDLESRMVLPKRGPGFGFSDLVWKKPVLAGDELTYFARVIDARRSASKPGWGILTNRNYALNQRGDAVFAFTGAVLWQSRS